MSYLSKHKFTLILSAAIIAYILYFSFYTILRYQNMGASYFDLGIMHQTVFNTYRAITEGDFSRVLEHTNPHGGGAQVKRMAIHNDVILALLSPFYLIHNSPITLLVIQTIVLALGAVAVFKIAQHVFGKDKRFLSLAFALAYLLYTPMQRANIFDFHAVVLSTSFLLFMYYFWLKKRWFLSSIFFVLSLLTKENLGLTTFLFGAYALFDTYYSQHSLKHALHTKNVISRFMSSAINHIKQLIHFTITQVKKKNMAVIFAVSIMAISIVWFFLSVVVIMPNYRGEQHFATKYYGDFGSSPVEVIIGILKNPYSILKYIIHPDTGRYFWFLLGPLLFLSILSPLHLMIIGPEFAINLLSNNWNMRNIVFHYTSVLQPFIFIASIYGASRIKKINHSYLAAAILISALLFSFLKGPLPYSLEKDTYAFSPSQGQEDIYFWKDYLKDEHIKVSSTGHLGPHFTSRRYFYDFSDTYKLADYVIVQPEEIKHGFQQEITQPAYAQLQSDWNFMKIYDKNGVEVYKKVKSIIVN